MSEQVSWWDDDSDSADDDVVRHAPDDGRYHRPEAAQMSKMPFGKVSGIALIPRALRDGSSSGFDPTVAGPVHVDPEAPDGGVVFDPSAFTADEIDNAVTSVRRLHQAYYVLGQRPTRRGRSRNAEVTTESAVSDSGVPPRTYRTPRATTDGRPRQPEPLDDGFDDEPAPAPITRRPTRQVRSAVAATPSEPDYDVIAEMREQMAVMAAAINRLSTPAAPPQVRRDRRLPAVATVPAENTFEDDEETEDLPRPTRPTRTTRAGDRQTVRQAREAEETTPPNGVIYGFETLELPFVDGPIASKPKKQVVFDIPGAGRHSARYHEVVIAETCIVLVYDTRHDGHQYAPSDLGPQVAVTVDLPATKKSYRVSVMGFNFSLGVFDCIVLIRREDEEEELEGE
jgi:hypothetical protein